MPHGLRFYLRTAASVWLALLLCVFGAACGPALYQRSLEAAEARVDEARDADARWHAPYEFYFAEAQLAQARHEAAGASYEDAIRFAQTAENFGKRALRITLSRRKGEL